MKTAQVSVSGSAGWAGASQAGRSFVQFVAAIALARLLDPADYGLMALALVVSAFAMLFRDMGTGAGLVQRAALDDRLIGGVLRLNLVVGILLSGLCIAAATALSRVFDEPRLAPVLTFLAPSFLIASMGVVPQSLLERGQQFRTLAGLELTATTVAAMAAIAAALAGLGVYALVVQTVAGTALSTLLLWRRCSWRSRARGTLRDAYPLVGFSGNLFLFNALSYAHRNADSFLIGRFIGAADLGIYNLGYRVILFPLQNLTFVLARVSLPAYSRHQDRVEEVSQHYLRSLGLIAFITAPLMAMAWAVREPLIEVVLGPRWLAAASIIAWLAPVGLCQSLVSTSGSLLASFGRTDLLRNLGIIGVPFLVASFMIGLPWGIEGVAAAYCIANLLWVYPVLRSVMGVLESHFTAFVVAVWKPIAVAAATAAGARLAALGLADAGFGLLARLTLPLLAAASAYAVGCLLLRFPPAVATAKTLIKAISSSTNRW